MSGAHTHTHLLRLGAATHTQEETLQDSAAEVFFSGVAVVALLEAPQGGHTLIRDDISKILHTVLPLSDGSQSFTGG